MPAAKKAVNVADVHPALLKHNIYDPNQVNYVERTDFLKKICGHLDQQDRFEDFILNKKPGKGEIRAEMVDLAQQYVKLRNKGARLPNFSKWVMGLFAGNKDYSDWLAAEGQNAAKRKIIMSVDVVDILRSADTPHFASCFGKPAGTSPNVDRKLADSYNQAPWHYLPVIIAEKCPGIGIVYVDDENGKMMGRQWMHHARDRKTGEDILVLTQGYYGCLQGNNLARLMAGLKIKVGYTNYGGGTPIEYVGCFDKPIHHDLPTWEKGASVDIVKV